MNMLDENFTLAPVDPTLARVFAEIDKRIKLYDGAIDRRIEQLALNKEASNVAHLAAELARYGAAKAELIRLKELL